MEISQIVLTLFVIALCVVPVWLLVRAGNARNRILKKTLLARINNEKLPEKHDIWSNKCLALDQNENLIYITVGEDNKVSAEENIALSSITECQLMVNRVQVYKGDSASLKNLSSLMLKISTSDHGVKSVGIFDVQTEDALETTRYLEIGKRWRSVISEKIKATI